jgi:hypothetical protein
MMVWQDGCGVRWWLGTHFCREANVHTYSLHYNSANLNTRGSLLDLYIIFERYQYLDFVMVVYTACL